MSESILRRLPAVHEVLEWPGLKEADRNEGLSRWVLREAVRTVLARWRAEIRDGRAAGPPARDHLEDEILKEARRLSLPSLRPVLNATGVLLHTNLGRAPLPEDALRSVADVARGYSNLELDLGTGKRGLRYRHVEDLLCTITGAEAALVVNNNAGAVYLALRVLAAGKEVIVSRGELVEIGGSFRIPDILRESGARLVEVGTTNRTHLSDYEGAIGSSTGLLLKVHPSNYRVIGFQKQVSTEELVSLGRRYSLPVMEDLGSGRILDGGTEAPPGEPLVQDVLGAGTDLVTFSGDKLLGGPQAGILVGRREILDRIQAHPLNRVLRIDKLTLAALEATLLLYRDPNVAREKVPVLAMLCQDRKTLQGRARRIARRLRKALPPSVKVSVLPVTGRAGGGSMPMEALPGVGVRIQSAERDAEDILARLRSACPPVIARIEQDAVILDVRTLLGPADERRLCRSVGDALGPA